MRSIGAKGRMSGGSAVALAVVVLLVGGVLVTPIDLATPHVTSSSQVSAGDSIYVASPGDYYSPDTFENLPTYTNITVTFVYNATGESDTHTFTIIGEEGVQLPSDTSQEEINELSFGNSPAPLFNLNVSGFGDRNVSTFRSPGVGWYEFVCSEPAHFAMGMYGFIAFGMNLPSNLTLPNRVSVGGANLNFSPIDAAVIGALVLAFVLGYVVWRRRRSALRMPPEPDGHLKTTSTEAREVEVGREKGGG